MVDLGGYLAGIPFHHRSKWLGRPDMAHRLCVQEVHATNDPGINCIPLTVRIGLFYSIVILSFCLNSTFLDGEQASGGNGG